MKRVFGSLYLTENNVFRMDWVLPQLPQDRSMSALSGKYLSAPVGNLLLMGVLLHLSRNQRRPSGSGSPDLPSKELVPSRVESALTFDSFWERVEDDRFAPFRPPE